MVTQAGGTPSTDSAGPVRRESLPQQVAWRLMRRIVEDSLPPGSPLPTEQELMHEYGVGKSAIREAVRIVATKGLVEVMQGSGMRVAPQRRWNLIDPELVALAGRSLVSMEHLLEVRRTVEPGIAVLAARHATQDDLTELQRIVERTVADGDDGPAIVAHDVAFHDALATATDNPLYTILLGSLTELQVEMRRGLIRSLGARERGLAFHHRILKAIRDRDEESARRLMVEHMEQVTDDWHSVEVQGPMVRGR
jgi:DNA-binding FadR family transcriptional regulator